MGKDLSDLRITVLSENKYITKTITDALKDVGVGNFNHFYEHKEALNSMREELPDILIVGWNAGGKHAIEIADYIRKHEQSPSHYLPMILIHSFTDIKEINLARDIGINECVMMPFNVKSIKNKISSIINHPRGFIDTDNYIGPDRRRRNDPEYNGPERRKGKGLSESQILELLEQNKQ
jgi:response regulator RpfG family c-di-GMP phosphodiesterase